MKRILLLSLFTFLIQGCSKEPIADFIFGVETNYNISGEYSLGGPIQHWRIGDSLKIDYKLDSITNKNGINTTLFKLLFYLFYKLFFGRFIKSS